MLNALLLRLGRTQGYSFSPLLFNIVLEVPTMVIRQVKEIKGKHTGKEGKLNVFTSDMFHYIGSPKEFILNQMSSTGYRIDIRSIYKNQFYFFYE